LAKIAIEVERALASRKEQGTPGFATPRLLAQGDGWTVADVICTSGPHDRPFEEEHAQHTIAIVLSGSFQYRSSLGGGVMTPGSLMLGNPGQCYECGHEHGEGDRCVSFWFAPEYFERITADAGDRTRRQAFRVARIAPTPSLSSLVARAAAGALCPDDDVPWEEIGVRLAAHVTGGDIGAAAGTNGVPPGAAARVTRTVRSIERHPDAPLTLARLSREAGLSPYHFLRVFEQLTGTTPHQYVLRARLREAAIRLATEPGKVLDIALDCGFGDVSNFNRAFRGEFGISPRAYRRPPRAGVR
jgi:AraC-like DNA-binding protein